ncbi:MAG: c-type cytochrome [Ginsengibacter sp.]
MKKLSRSGSLALVTILFLLLSIAVELIDTPEMQNEYQVFQDSTWIAPSLYTDRITTGEQRKMIMYGEDLISKTANFLGPQGSVLQISNGMNCQNCHLDAGRRPWGNNFGATYAGYPRFRNRSGTIENIYRRINDCFERSMNGKLLDSNSYEMKSMYAYIKWVGENVPGNTKPYGSGLQSLPYLQRAASPENGRKVFEMACISCHGSNGEGLKLNGQPGYLYPPLWGAASYNDGAGLYRISGFAGFIKSNMPYDKASHDSPFLSNEEAWDVAAFVNSQPRPHKDQSDDYKDLSGKPVDFPFGPYVDTFNERQHKYGPFQPIAATKKKP